MQVSPARLQAFFCLSFLPVPAEPFGIGFRPVPGAPSGVGSRPVPGAPPGSGGGVLGIIS